MFSEDYILEKIRYWNNQLNKVQRGHERSYPEMRYTNDTRYYGPGYRNRSTFRNLDRRYGRKNNGY